VISVDFQAKKIKRDFLRNLAAKKNFILFFLDNELAAKKVRERVH